MVEDRRFKVLVEVESWEEANPILFGEDLDRRLVLDIVEAQESFIRLTGFSSVPARDPQMTVRSHSDGGSGLGHQRINPVLRSPARQGR